MRIYVGNLSFDTTDESLANAFKAHGSVRTAEVVRDRESGQTRGFGFVEMSDNAEGENAIRALDQTQLDGRAVSVSVARAREERGGGGGGGRRNRY